MQEKYLRCPKCDNVDFVRSEIGRYIDLGTKTDNPIYSGDQQKNKKEYQLSDPKTEYRCISCSHSIIFN